jgi:hypothetical protein
MPHRSDTASQCSGRSSPTEPESSGGAQPAWATDLWPPMEGSQLSLLSFYNHSHNFLTLVYIFSLQLKCFMSFHAIVKCWCESTL